MRGKIAILIVMVFLNDSCKKKTSVITPLDKDPDIAGKTKQEVFMMQPWYLVNWIDSSKGGQFENIETCSQDNTYTFNTSSNMVLDRGSVQCNMAELKIENMAWSMKIPNDTAITVFGNVWRIEAQTGGMMKIRYRNFDVGLSNYIYHTVTFRRKRI
jgi:hypothetical protein